MVRNSNAPQGWVTTFKDLGAFIAIYDEIVSGNLGIQAKLTAAVEQQDYDYGTVKSLSTFINNMVSASTNLATAKTNLISSATNYLTTVTTIDIASTATTASGILADIVGQLASTTEVDNPSAGAPSGIYVLSSGHFHSFFWDEYGVEFAPTSGALLLTGTDGMDLISGIFLTSPQLLVDDAYGD